MNEYPVKVRIDYRETSSRGWAVLTIFLIKFLALIPHFIVLVALAIAAAVVFVIAQVAVVSRGVFPPGLFAFLTGYVRWYARVSAFTLSLTDRYPPFSLDSDPDYPVDVDVEYPQSSSKTLAALSLLFVVIGIVVFVVSIGYLIDTATPDGSSWRNAWGWWSTGAENGLALLRNILLIPHLIVVAILGIAAGIIWFIVQWVILFVARFPEGMHRFVSQWIGWSTRVAAYSNGLTDRYPPFSLETIAAGPARPGQPAAGATLAPPPPPLPPAPQPPAPQEPASGGEWVDERFPSQGTGEERTTELPQVPPADSGEQLPAGPGGTPGQTPPEPPGGEPEETPPEPPATGPTQPPTPPQAPPPPPVPQ